MPAELVNAIVTSTSLVSLAIMVLHLFLWARRLPSANDGNPDYDRAIIFSILVLFGLVFNAALCGAVSGPYYRYQARVVWLAVVAASLLEVSRPLVTQHVHRPRTQALSKSPTK